MMRGKSLIDRLAGAADGDVREWARSALVGDHVDSATLNQWADLMDEAAAALGGGDMHNAPNEGEPVQKMHELGDVLPRDRQIELMDSAEGRHSEVVAGWAACPEVKLALSSGPVGAITGGLYLSCPRCGGPMEPGAPGDLYSPNDECFKADTASAMRFVRSMRKREEFAKAVALVRDWANESNWDSHADLERFLMHLKRAAGQRKAMTEFNAACERQDMEAACDALDELDRSIAGNPTT